MDADQVSKGDHPSLPMLSKCDLFLYMIQYCVTSGGDSSAPAAPRCALQLAVRTATRYHIETPLAAEVALVVAVPWALLVGTCSPNYIIHTGGANLVDVWANYCCHLVNYVLCPLQKQYVS
jgi:hypothetical protein